MGTQYFMECPTCLGGTNPRYTLTPCPNCWGSKKIPQVSSTMRRAMVRLYGRRSSGRR
jgi:hypothetical protein